MAPPSYSNNLEDVKKILQDVFLEGGSRSRIDVLTCTAGGTFQKLYANELFVRSATIQNITTTLSTVITLLTEDVNTTPTAGIGILLNAAGIKNTGGGSKTFGNIDVSKIQWTATNTSDQIAVELEYGSYGSSHPDEQRGPPQ